MVQFATTCQHETLVIPNCLYALDVPSLVPGRWSDSEDAWFSNISAAKRGGTVDMKANVIRIEGILVAVLPGGEGGWFE